jgi:hypothetical protein
MERAAKNNDTQKIWEQLIDSIRDPSGEKRNQDYSPELQRTALMAFMYLCEKGCDSSILANLLVLLALKKPVRTKSSEFSVRPFDSKKTALALDPRTVGGILRRGQEIREEMRRIIVKLKELKKKVGNFDKDIRFLRKQPLVRKLVLEAVIEPGDLLYGSLVTIQSESFRGLQELTTHLQQTGKRKKPDYIRIRKTIHSYVRKETGRWHDDKMADILTALLPDQDEITQGSESVKQWRYNHDLTDETEKKLSL